MFAFVYCTPTSKWYGERLEEPGVSGWVRTRRRHGSACCRWQWVRLRILIRDMYRSHVNQPLEPQFCMKSPKSPYKSGFFKHLHKMLRENR